MSTSAKPSDHSLGFTPEDWTLHCTFFFWIWRSAKKARASPCVSRHQLHSHHARVSVMVFGYLCTPHPHRPDTSTSSPRRVAVSEVWGSITALCGPVRSPALRRSLQRPSAGMQARRHRRRASSTRTAARPSRSSRPPRSSCRGTCARCGKSPPHRP